MPGLGVNVDHVATLRQARGGIEPDPVLAASICEAAGCDSIVCHLREDRRHINERDLYLLRDTVRTRLNMEMAIAEGIVRTALKVKPDEATLVPERRRELTTEGGLNCVKYRKEITAVVRRLQRKNITVSLFIDADKKQIAAALSTGAEFIELHTGEYANAGEESERHSQISKLADTAEYAIRLGLRVNAGHGLNYINVTEVAKIKGIEELNIGHSIISRAVFVGLDKAVREMRALIK